jgi:hypothetical protein
MAKLSIRPVRCGFVRSNMGTDSPGAEDSEFDRWSFAIKKAANLSCLA